MYFFRYFIFFKYFLIVFYKLQFNDTAALFYCFTLAVIASKQRVSSYPKYQRVHKIGVIPFLPSIRVRFTGSRYKIKTSKIIMSTEKRLKAPTALWCFHCSRSCNLNVTQRQLEV